MIKEKVTLWNREFDLPIIYSCYPGEEVTTIQQEAKKIFCSNTSVAMKALEEIKQYIERTSDSEVNAENIDNIFKYVIPKRIFIPRTDKKIVAILCDYKFDMENGIAVVFENEKFKEIGVQDIIL